ncbi:MAG TPA: M20/M25/M40 family metallo-hydrolase [Candidatus Binatia bacterium]|nr:M20/M25/M40 family metallo-hydrolase [Candidatus Binatia bacterium]
MIDRARLQSLFLELVRIDSLSRREGRIAARLADELRALGATVGFDDAAARVQGEVGNLIAHVAGTPDAPPLLLCAHMDTVSPGEGVRPVVDGDVIRSDGSTVLGGDDKSGVAIVCECVRVCRERGLRHPPLDVVFTICEEVGLLGAKHLDVGRLRAKRGLVFDSDAVGCAFTRAPGANHLDIAVHGRAAHAGMAPERGVSAIRVAAEAIAAMRIGRLDAETTANIGVIQGGRATNIVPDAVQVRGEARSHDPAKLAAQTAHMRACFEEAAARHPGARVEIAVDAAYEPMVVADDSAIMRLVVAAAARTGRTITPAGMGGGCDANVLNRRGLEVVNLGTGMREIHTTSEWLSVTDMVAAAEVTLAVIELAAEVRE